MKKIIIVLIIFGLFLPAAVALAKFPDDLPVFSVMPDSTFYFLKIWYEKVVIFFTFDLAKRAERYTTFAEKRAYEAEKMVKEGKVDLAVKLEETYKSYLNKAREALEKAIQKAIDKKKEALKQELDKKVEDVMNKLKESINL
jgi:hypothetical protein